MVIFGGTLELYWDSRNKMETLGPFKGIYNVVCIGVILG